MKKMEREISKHLIDFQKTGIPKCLTCGKKFIHAVDSKTKMKSEYLWKADCECLPKNMVLSIG